MTALNCRRIGALVVLGLLAGWTRPAFATAHNFQNDPPPVAEEAPAPSPEVPGVEPVGPPAPPMIPEAKLRQKSAPANASDSRVVPLGSIPMRAVAQRLDQISLWRDEDEKPADPAVWDGVDEKDTAAILPGLVAAKDAHARQIALRIAMSAVYTPAGISDEDYVRWRASVLAAQHKYTEAARLLNVARIGRDSNTDLMPRITYELAAEQPESACAESMAAGHAPDAPFWQGMGVLCARELGDADAAKKLAAAMPDGPNNDVKTAAAKIGDDPKPLMAALVNASGVLAVPALIADNADILAQLKKQLDDIKSVDDPKAAAHDTQGELLMLSLGALAADKRGDDTQKLAGEALKLVGIN